MQNETEIIAEDAFLAIVSWRGTAVDGSDSKGTDMFPCHGDMEGEQEEYLRRRGYKEIEIISTARREIVQ